MIELVMRSAVAWVLFAVVSSACGASEPRPVRPPTRPVASERADVGSAAGAETEPSRQVKLGPAVAAGSPVLPSPTSTLPEAAPAKFSDAKGNTEHQLKVELEKTRFSLDKQSGNEAVISEIGTPRKIEIFAMDPQPCDKDRLPKIGANSATTLGPEEPHRTLKRQWFVQRSPSERASRVADGLYVCSATKMVVVRYIGPEASMKTAREDLKKLFAQGQIVLE